ncbi:MAG: hypothetical protein AB8V19_01565 [Candidatus Midichloria sp.]|uniref:Uncharacterized protein n=1 Tax=Hyalomma marginatum TaxID=34627 RepID=A0A8S4BWU6_9ACAR|nr:hypothetical protein MHYMCMPSP_00975 [Hyalomma marginatum]CAG7600724.1 hypothetical protein MHYMCMPASI_01201 [Hyalomma marginatum]
MIGGPIGHLIGGVTGQVLDQLLFGSTKVKTEGSRLERVYFQSAAYGKFIPINLWISKKLSGNIIWASRLKNKHS